MLNAEFKDLFPQLQLGGFCSEAEGCEPWDMVGDGVEAAFRNYSCEIISLRAQNEHPSLVGS